MLRIVFSAVTTDTQLNLLPSSVKQRYDFLAWHLGLLHLAFIFPAHPSAQFSPTAWDGLPSWLMLLLLLAGNGFKTPCFYNTWAHSSSPAPMPSLIWNISQIPKPWAAALISEDAAFFSLTLWNKCYILPWVVALAWNLFAFLRAGNQWTHVWFPRETSDCACWFHRWSILWIYWSGTNPHGGKDYRDGGQPDRLWGWCSLTSD